MIFTRPELGCYGTYMKNFINNNGLMMMGGYHFESLFTLFFTYFPFHNTAQAGFCLTKGKVCPCLATSEYSAREKKNAPDRAFYCVVAYEQLEKLFFRMFIFSFMYRYTNRFLCYALLVSISS